MRPCGRDKEEAKIEAALKKLLARQQHSKPRTRGQHPRRSRRRLLRRPMNRRSRNLYEYRRAMLSRSSRRFQSRTLSSARWRRHVLLPQPENSATVPLTRRAQALVANARRREAVLACKLKALTLEVEHFRKREVEAVRINHGLRRRLRDALTDLDAIALRREVRTLRADLSAALAREAALQRSVLLANQRIEADYIKIGEHGVKERKLRDDMEYLRRVAYNAMAARASAAMGVGTLYD